MPKTTKSNQWRIVKRPALNVAYEPTTTRVTIKPPTSHVNRLVSVKRSIARRSMMISSLKMGDYTLPSRQASQSSTADLLGGGQAQDEPGGFPSPGSSSRDISLESTYPTEDSTTDKASRRPAAASCRPPRPVRARR